MLREWHRLHHNAALLFVTFIGPGLAFVLIALIFSANVPHDLPVGIVDRDHSTFSRQIARMINASSIAKIHCDCNSLDEARQSMENGSIDAIIYIPEGFENDIFRSVPPRVAVYINNANVLKGGLLNSGIRKVMSSFSAGIKLQVKMKSGLTQEQAMNRIMPVQLRQKILFNPYTSYSYYLTAALLGIFLITFVLLGTIYSIGDELYHGTGPQWLRAGDKKFLLSLMGKILPYTLIYFCWSIVLNYILFYQLGMPLHGKFLLILLSELLLILSYQSMAIAFVGFTSNMRLSLSLGSAYAMLALTYSGLTFPVAGMSTFSQAFARIFPFTYWIKILISQSLRGEPVHHVIIPILFLLIFIGFGLLFVPRFQHVLMKRNRWGKI